MFSRIPEESRCTMINLLNALRCFGIISDKHKRHTVGYTRALILKEALRQARISTKNETIDACKTMERHRWHQI